MIKEFEDTQYIDLSNIKCGECKTNNKSISNNNEFYICLNCKINLCPLCKTNHSKSHNIINYDQKDYICEIHNEIYNSYCKTCHKNLCVLCENNHNSHSIKYLNNLSKDKKELNEKLEYLRKAINKFNAYANSIINVMNDAKENMEKYYQIANDLISNYEIKKRNFQVLHNVNRIINAPIFDDIEKVIMSNNYNSLIKNIMDLYNKIYINELTIYYKVNKNEDTIKIFNSLFVKDNKKNCKIQFEDKELDLQEKLNIRNYNKDILEIKLKGISNLKELNFMFAECSSLISVPDLSKMNVTQICDLSGIFHCCSSIESLPDISKWNTKSAIHMRCLFSGCESLLSIPDISNWDTSNVKAMDNMFAVCSKIKSLPDISKWNVKNVLSMENMFYGCSSLKSLPDISKWNADNIECVNNIFEGCKEISSFPDISRWKVSK